MATITVPGMFLTGTHAGRPAANTVGKGSVYSCSDHGLIYQSDGSSWTTWFSSAGAAASLGSWSTYTPTWTATSVNPAIGNGTITGRYIDSGKVRFLKIRIVWGSTTTNGTGNYRWTYPSGAHSVRWILDASHYDASASQYRFGQAWTAFVDSTHIAVVVGAGGNVEWGASQPVVHANGDILDIAGIAELD